MAERHVVTLHQTDRSERAEELRVKLAQALGIGTVGAPDATGMVELELTASSRDQALGRVRDALSAVGGDDHFLFPEQTGTEFHSPGERRDTAGGAELSETGAPTDETRRPTWLEERSEPPRRSPTEEDVPEPATDQTGPEDEPPHLERGSPRADEPAPFDPPPRDLP